jgi:hypothetical protein
LGRFHLVRSNLWWRFSNIFSLQRNRFDLFWWGLRMLPGLSCFISLYWLYKRLIGLAVLLVYLDLCVFVLVWDLSGKRTLRENWQRFDHLFFTSTNTFHASEGIASYNLSVFWMWCFISKWGPVRVVLIGWHNNILIWLRTQVKENVVFWNLRSHDFLLSFCIKLDEVWRERKDWGVILELEALLHERIASERHAELWLLIRNLLNAYVRVLLKWDFGI